MGDICNRVGACGDYAPGVACIWYNQGISAFKAVILYYKKIIRWWERMNEAMKTAMETAFTTVKTDVLSSIQTALPVGLAILGASLAIMLGVKFFKKIASK